MIISAKNSERYILFSQHHSTQHHAFPSHRPLQSTHKAFIGPGEIERAVSLPTATCKASGTDTGCMDAHRNK